MTHLAFSDGVAPARGKAAESSGVGNVPADDDLGDGVPASLLVKELLQ